MKTLARARDTAEVLARLRAVRPDALRRWGRMSVDQMICHLSDSFRMAMGQRAVTPATGLFQRTLMKWIALYAPLPWPGGIETPPEIDQCAGGGTTPVQFASDLAELEALAGIFASATTTGGWPPHPIFGPLSKAAWLRWGYLHTDFHLRQFGA